MEAYKAEFIQFLIDTGALKIGGPFKLKSGRMSPYFLNAGDFSSGADLTKIGEAYAEAAQHSIGLDKFDIVYGPAYKGIQLAVATSMGLSRRGADKGFVYNRKEAKMHGEATGSATTKEQLQKEIMVGRWLKDGSNVLMVDDVFTTGETKEEALKILRAVANDVRVVAGLIAVDRQEINEDGEAAITQFTKATGIPFYAVVTVSDIIDYLKENNKLSPNDEAALKRYLRAWGTREVREKYGLGEERLIEGNSVIPACDVDIEKFEEIVKSTKDEPLIGGYKLPATAGHEGWLACIEIARRHTSKPLIYDHQKAGNDIPDTAQRFMEKLKLAGFDAVIIFPHSGPRTQVAWTGEALQQGLQVLVGADMTHEKYKRSEGGYISDEALEEIYIRAARQGVTHFVVPGNKTDRIALYRQLIQAEGVKPIFFAPGFVAQGGSISDAAKAAGDNWHAIVGRGIYAAPDIKAAVKELTSQL